MLIAVTSLRAKEMVTNEFKYFILQPDLKVYRIHYGKNKATF